MRSVNIAIPGEGEEEDFWLVQEKRWRRDFANVHEFDEIEQALYSVLCTVVHGLLHQPSNVQNCTWPPASTLKGLMQEAMYSFKVGECCINPRVDAAFSNFKKQIQVMRLPLRTFVSPEV